MRQCPSCGQLTLDIVPGRNYLQCTRYSCGHREPVVDPKDARIAELEAQVAELKRIINVIDKHAQPAAFRQRSSWSTSEVLDYWTVDFTSVRPPRELTDLVLRCSPSGQARTIIEWEQEVSGDE